jgi:hypothetical protein
MNVTRSGSAAESDQQRREKLANAGLKVWSKLPRWMDVICWPTVVGFSLSTKQWGFVLIDGLENITRNTVAWDHLVLESKTKEMLLAMAASTLKGDKLGVFEGGEDDVILQKLKKEPRYRFNDVVDSKGGGCLFLLYGPPGSFDEFT